MTSEQHRRGPAAARWGAAAAVLLAAGAALYAQADEGRPHYLNGVAAPPAGHSSLASGVADGGWELSASKRSGGVWCLWFQRQDAGGGSCGETPGGPPVVTPVGVAGIAPGGATEVELVTSAGTTRTRVVDSPALGGIRYFKVVWTEPTALVGLRYLDAAGRETAEWPPGG